VHLVEKPFSEAVLVAKVREILHGRSAIHPNGWQEHGHPAPMHEA
jgi:hypothetical protein